MDHSHYTDASQLLLPLMYKYDLFSDARFADIGTPEEWDQGLIDMPIETLEAVCDELGVTLVRRQKRWYVYHRDQPVLATSKVK